MKLPHITLYRDRLPKNSAGRAYGPVIVILEDYREDHRLWRHEYEHVRQWYASLFTHGIWYTLVRRYRAWAEAKAYAVQVRLDRSDLDEMAYRMALPVYDLHMTQEECRAAIEKHLS